MGQMTPTTSLTTAQRPQESRTYVHRLMAKRQPAFAAALAAAERDLCCPFWPCQQREMIAHRLITTLAIGRP